MIKNIQEHLGGCLAFPLLAGLVGGSWLLVLHVLVPVTRGLPAPLRGVLMFVAAIMLVGIVVLLMTLWFTRGASTRPLLGGEAGKSRKTTGEKRYGKAGAECRKNKQDKQDTQDR